MSAKMRFFRFCKSYVTLDLRQSVMEQRVAAIRKKARKFEMLNRTDGIISSFE